MIGINKILLTAGIVILLTSFTTQLPLSKHTFIVVAHRGDHTAAPENTLAAFENAITTGADYVEIDLRTTKDSQLIIMHDATLNRMTNGTDKVNEHTLAELKQLKVQDKQHPDWGQYTIPDFDEVLKLCKGRINIYLDFKEADPAYTYRYILAAGMEKSIVVYINKASQLSAWRNVAPRMPLMVSLPHPVKEEKEMQQLLDSLYIDVLDGAYYEYTPELVKVASQKNVPVWADIQNPAEGPAQWDKALQLHLAGLQTDHPAALIAYLKSKGLR
jgi:glycerophosphoryl diester phosphodiesterase